MREIDRFRAISWCARFEWESARCGIAGASRLELLDVERVVPTEVTDLFDIFESKNDVECPCSGVIGDDSIEELSGVVAGLSRKLLEMWEKSESSPDRRDEFDDEAVIDRMSGALSA